MISAYRRRSGCCSVGFVMLMTLMVTVVYNDLTRVAWIERLMLWR